MTSAIEPPPPSCLDCGARLHGPHCSECGQRARDPDPTLRDLIGEAWDAVTNLDGRVGLTLRRLMLRPGALTTEYLRGHRTRYLPPLRLYLICSVGYFLVASLVPDRSSQPAIRLLSQQDSVAARRRKIAVADSMRRVLEPSRRKRLIEHGIVPPVGQLDSVMIVRSDSIVMTRRVAAMTVLPKALQARLSRAMLRLEFNRGLHRNFETQMPRLMFVLMPILAVFLALAYRSRHRRYPVHLIVALHVHAFAFAVLLLDSASNVLPSRGLRLVVGVPLVLWSLAYFPLALRQVYGGRLGYAIARFALLFIAYLLVMLVLLVSVELGQLLFD